MHTRTVTLRRQEIPYKNNNFLYTNPMAQKTVSEARESFAEVLAHVDSEPVEIFRHGERVAVIVSPTMYDRSLEALEDIADEQAFDDVQRDESVPWEDIKKELGLA
jgi:prevent-host-death family protein